MKKQYDDASIEAEFARLMNENISRGLKKGQVVKGLVTGFSKGKINLRIKEKYDGMIMASLEGLEKGDTIEARVLSFKKGVYSLSLEKHIPKSKKGSAPDISKKKRAKVKNAETPVENIMEIKTGDIVEGYVVSVIPDTVILDVNEEYTGLISIDEYSDEPVSDLMSAVKIGDVIKCRVIKINEDELTLSCKKSRTI